MTSEVLIQENAIILASARKLVSLGSEISQSLVNGIEEKGKESDWIKIFQLLTAYRRKAVMDDKQLESILYDLRNLSGEDEFPSVSPLVGRDIEYRFVTSGVESVTGTYVDNTDPVNPIVDVSALEQRVEDLENILESQSGFTGYAYAVWTGVGLTFDVYFPAYYINGIRYDAGTGQVTLDAADPSNPRLDVIGVDATGEIFITGSPAVDPVKPTVDPLTQLEITTVLINAGATTPEITNEQVYDENVEWVGSSNNGAVTFNNAVTPSSGSVCTDVPSFNATHYIDYTDGGTHDLTDFSILQYLIRQATVFTATTYLRVTLFNGATQITNPVNILTGVSLYNWVRTITGSYQTVVVPASAFTIISGSTFDRIRFSFNGSNAAGFKLDDIIFQTGNGTISPLQPALVTIVTDSGSATATDANDTFTLNGSEGTLVTASGKAIAITALPLVTASGTDTYTGTVPTTVATNHVFRVKIPNNNTGASTFNAVAIKKNVTEDLAADDLKANGVYIFHYDGTNYQVIGLGGGGGGGTPGGSDTQVQYNSSSAFAGISGATSNGTILSVTTAANGTNTTQAASTAFVQNAVLSSPYNVGSNLFLYYNFY